MQTVARDFFSKQVTGNLFQDESCQIFQRVAQKSCGAAIILEMFKTQLDIALNNTL